jgi:small-conductance mechanosensitive channel
MRRKFPLFLSIFLMLSVPQLSADPSADLIQMLHQSVGWYHIVAGEREFATTPADSAFVVDNARISDDVLRLAFEFARNQQKLLGKQSHGEANASQEQAAASSRYDALREMARSLDARTQQSQQELDSLRRKLDTAADNKRRDIQSDIAETQSEFQLFEARRDVMHTMLDFVGSTMEGTDPSRLSGQIEALSRSVPAGLTTPTAAERGLGVASGISGTAGAKPEQQAVAASSNPTRLEASIPAPMIGAGKSEAEGLWALITNILSASRKVHTLDNDIKTTNSLRQSCRELQVPLLAQLKQMAHQSDAIAAQPDANNRALQTQEKGELDQLTAQFKLTSASFVPLSKAVTLLDLYSRNLTNWRSALSAQYAANLKLLLTRLLTLVVILGTVWGVAAGWRRSIFRYVHDTRRRHQMLLLRRISVWFVVALIFIFSFASELGSLATFAGLLTAGVAVALQNVILSVAGYFFLIGKFGVRVGDRVQISGVNGEVVEIGLVRIHVMELGGTGRDVQPTGRVVAFSNSFVFQSTAGVFKQIPGTNFIWHEIALTLAIDSDYRAVEERMVKSVDSAFASYHDVLEKQRLQMEKSLASGVTLSPLRPRTTLKRASSGLEVKVSFPVDVTQADQIDDRITREILKELEREPKLNIVGSDIPTIREIAKATSA